VNRPALLLLLCLALVGASDTVLAQRSSLERPKPMPPDITPRVHPSQCGGFTGHFGPFDYRKANRAEIRTVEEYHFDMELQTFLTGRVYGRNRAGTSEVAGGFQYVLKALPNHPAALLVMDQLGRRLRSEQPQNIEFPLECFYVRAFMITPDDPAVRALYGVYLAHRQRRDEAIRNLDLGDAGLPLNGSLQHQIGLANLLLGRHERAQLNALRAARVGFPLDTVARELRRQGKWNAALELPPEPRPEAAASAAGVEQPASAAAPAAP
jgi:hypothetical protein